MISLQSLIHKKVVVLPHNATLRDAARALCDNQIGCALVASTNGDPAGIVTDRDLACSWGDDAPTPDRSVDELMSRELFTASENAGLSDILALMETHGVRRIPLVSALDRTGYRRFIGLITLDDLIAAELVEKTQLARIIQRQIGRRLTSRAHPHGAEYRSDARKRQTLQRFYLHLVSSTGVPEDILPQVTQSILGSLMMRVSMTAASHFAAQLPEQIREPLLRLPIGPDKNISARSVVEDLVRRFGFTESHARTVLQRMIGALTAWMSPGHLDHLRAQLPEDFEPFFAPPRGVATLNVTSPSFSDGGIIPRFFTGDGSNRSPQIDTSNIPPGTREFALICEDSDAKTEVPWVHWVMYGIPGTVTRIPEGIATLPEVHAPILARQGKNTSGTFGYQGPLPPEKDPWHHYTFRLYALDREITLLPGATAEDLRQELKGHILGEGTLSGRYKRARKAVA